MYSKRLNIITNTLLTISKTLLCVVDKMAYIFKMGAVHSGESIVVRGDSAAFTSLSSTECIHVRELLRMDLGVGGSLNKSHNAQLAKKYREYGEKKQKFLKQNPDNQKSENIGRDNDGFLGLLTEEFSKKQETRDGQSSPSSSPPQLDAHPKGQAQTGTADNHEVHSIPQCSIIKAQVRSSNEGRTH